jgi:hypothetical protein
MWREVITISMTMTTCAMAMVRPAIRTPGSARISRTVRRAGEGEAEARCTSLARSRGSGHSRTTTRTAPREKKPALAA